MNFKDKFSDYPDSKLVEMWSKRDDYDVEAIDAIRFHINERGISFDEIGSVNDSTDVKDVNPIIKKIILHATNIPTAIKSLIVPLKLDKWKSVCRGIGILMIIISLYNLNFIIKEFNYKHAFESFEIQNFLNIPLNQFYVWLLTFSIPLFGGLLIYFYRNVGWYLSVMYIEYQLLSEIPLNLYFLKNIDYYGSVEILLKFCLILLYLILIYRLFSIEIRKGVKLESKIALVVVVVVGIYSIIQSISVLKYMETLLN